MTLMTLLDFQDALQILNVKLREQNAKRMKRIRKFFKDEEGRQALRRASLCLQVTGQVEKFMAAKRVPRRLLFWASPRGTYMRSWKRERATFSTSCRRIPICNWLQPRPHLFGALSTCCCGSIGCRRGLRLSVCYAANGILRLI